jgi:hypothetical protein
MTSVIQEEILGNFYFKRTNYVQYQYKFFAGKINKRYSTGKILRDGQVLV